MGQGFFKASYFNNLSKVDFTEEEEAAIKKQIQTEAVLLYSKSYCPYCTLTKQLLSSKKVDTTIQEINLADNGLTIQAILFKLTGQSTVPNLFIQGQHVGGNSDVQALAKSGELKRLLDAKGIPNEF